MTLSGDGVREIEGGGDCRYGLVKSGAAKYFVSRRMAGLKKDEYKEERRERWEKGDEHARRGRNWVE